MSRTKYGTVLDVLNDSAKWRNLVHEYSELRDRSDGMTPQRRGQRFNGLIAELFSVFGLTASANQYGVGEVDVTFRHASQHFILEAKWENKKTATGHIAKLQRRVEQRMSGLTGVFLSMEGYTKDALVELRVGRRLELVLLDRRHWEAMLSGFVPPAELLDLVTEAAFFRGEPYTDLDVLLQTRAAVPTAQFDPHKSSNPSFRTTADKVTTRLVLDGVESRQLGIASTDADRLLITTDHGVLEVDPTARKAGWALSISGCHGSALPLDDTVIVQRAHGIGRFRNGKLEALSSGGVAEKRTQLLSHPDGSAWCFDPGKSGADYTTPTTLIGLGPDLGNEQVIEVPYPPGVATGAVLLDSKVLLTGVPDEGAGHYRAALPRALPAAALPLDDRRVMSLDRDSTLRISDLSSDQEAEVLRLDDVDVLACRLTRGPRNSVYATVLYRRHQTTSRIAVLHVSAAKPWSSLLVPRRQTRVQDTSAQPESTKPVPAPEPSMRPPVVEPHNVPSPADVRLVDLRRGEQDGSSLATRLPLFALEGAVAVNFDVVRWLQPWRDGWRMIVISEAPPGAVLVDWLPLVARYLGVFAAPMEVVDAHFTPSPAYVTGFGHGLRSAWEEALRRRVVPRHPHELSDWLRQPPGGAAGTRVAHLGDLTLKDLRAATVRTRMTSTWTWMGRIALWLATAFLAILAVAGIAITIDGGWPDNSAATATAVNILFIGTFAVLLALSLYDLRKLVRRKKERQAHRP